MRFAMKIHLLEKFLVKLKKRVVKIAIKLQHYICIGICDFGYFDFHHQCRSVVQLDLFLLSGNKNGCGNGRQRKD
ncbi:hypothetical protein T10_476 [Trichinella papuae]|uniref:Uncharacterized protein n=1 Tax=Trichinella papuae TaxID=268474 RepID=A0A0V1MU28_9BILA|nr:hypothetical protein T10_476 [Trichinella papuae]